MATKFVNGAKTAAKWGTGIATAAIGAATAMTASATSAAGVADDVDKMSAKIGISREAYQEWKYVLGQNGMEITKLQAGMKTLTTQISALQAVRIKQWAVLMLLVFPLLMKQER